MLNLLLRSPVHSVRRWLARALPVAATAVLVACGGGGGGGSSPLDNVQGPPETAATLAASANDASQATQAVVDAAINLAEQSSGLTGLEGLFGTPIGLQRVVASATRVRPLAETIGCADFLDTFNCTGSAVVDTNVSENATSLRRGDFFSISFLNLTGSLLGQQVVMNGAMRLDLLAPLNPDNFSSVDMVLTFTAFRGSVAGVAFGPIDQIGRLQVSAQGDITLTADGQRITGLGGVTYTGADSFTVSGSSVRTAHWTNTAQYVDLNLTNWRMSGGRPIVGSAGEVVANSGGIGVVVVGRTDSSVTYDAVITLGGTSTRFRVTAIYPAGGGAPGYSAVPL